MKNLATTFLAMTYCICLCAQSSVCPNPGATQKKVASSFHSTIMIDYNGDVKYWGDGANPSAPNDVSYVLSPAILSNEPAGKNYIPYLTEFVNYWKKRDPL